MLNNWKKLWDLEVQINTDPSQLMKRLSIHWVSPFSVKNCGKSKKCAFKLLSHKSLYGTAGKGKSSNYCAYVIESASTLTHALFFFLADFVFCTYIVLYILYMMTSVGSERIRGTRDKTQISVTPPTQPQKQIVQVCATVLTLTWKWECNDTSFFP